MKKQFGVELSEVHLYEKASDMTKQINFKADGEEKRIVLFVDDYNDFVESMNTSGLIKKILQIHPDIIF